MNKKLSVLAMSLMMLGVLVVSPGVNAGTNDTTPKQTFKKKHPRRAEVNSRMRRENRRIKQGVKTGALTPAEANELKTKEKGIKLEERQDVKDNGGTLTKPQQGTLNKEENQLSKDIYKEKHDADTSK